MRRCDWAVLVLDVLLTVILTWPVSCNMNEMLAGHSSDPYHNLWVNWWTEKVLTEGQSLYYTDYLFYPYGVSLIFHSFSHANTALSLALAPLVGRFAAHNAVVLLAYALSGFGMYLLVSYLSGCRPAAFVAGLVFALNPYHISESDHPILVTTQWIPLFVLAFVRMLREPGARRVAQLFLAVLWFLMTALSSWHLMTMLIGWMVLYLLYSLVFERAGLVEGAGRSLVMFIVVSGLLLVPFLWPIVREQLTADTTFVAVDVGEGLGNDLLAFFLPNRWHPFFSSLFSDTYEHIGFTSRRSAYLGFVPLALAVGGMATARRKSRFWLLSGLVIFVLSLGATVVFCGKPLHTSTLPWAVPIIGVLRHPFRLNVLLFLSLSVLVGFGGRWLFGRLARRGRLPVYLAVALTICFVLFEYLTFPFPHTIPSYSPFIGQLAQEEGDFAVVDLPMGRKWAKYHMFYQMIHGKKIADGHISRTPDNAYDFVDASPLLGPLHAGTAPDLDANDIREQFAVLAEQGVRYIIVHKELVGAGEMEDWREWLADFPAAFYEDERLIAYRTTASQEVAWSSPVVAEIAEGLVLDGYLIHPRELRPGGTFYVTLRWRAAHDGLPSYGPDLVLRRGEEELARDDGVLFERYPTERWVAGEPLIETRRLTMPPTLEPLQLALMLDGRTVPVGTVAVAQDALLWEVPATAQPVCAHLGDVAELEGCGWEASVEQPGTWWLTLYWRGLADPPVEVSYTVFVHLLDSEARLLAQHDGLPDGGARLTTAWLPGEIVADRHELVLVGPRTGYARPQVGMYDLATMARLPAYDCAGRRLPDDIVSLPEVEVGGAP